MSRPCRTACLLGLFLALFCARVAAPQEPEKPAAGAKPVAETAVPAAGVEQLTESARKSVVVVTVLGRDGKQQGLGSGFVVAADGLIATNLHVIGEARPISVQTADGKKHDVVSIDAFDRPLDLALIRIAATGLPVLPLGDSESLKQGQGVVALGNPQGLRHSVVTGVVSGVREIDGRKMIQLAIPIEPGNSGGPLLDLQGRVHGLLTMKSAVTENLGFAVPVNSLKPLIEKPNPTPIARWLTIGALDPQEWTPVFGARWRQRAGRILVDGLGQSFGGRSLCLSETLPPDAPFEIAVTVKLDDEGGAAGLVFCADGGNVHYGFYPTAGRLRLTRFDGPDVFSWQILAETESTDYRPGEWNTIKVRFEKGKIRCFVNERSVIESTDARLTAGKVGLAKFRTTEAEFRNFRLGNDLTGQAPTDDVRARIGTLADGLPVTGRADLQLTEQLASEGAASVTVLRDRAQRMEQQAASLRKLAHAVHQRQVQAKLAETLRGDDASIDLFHAALLVAQLDNDEIDVEAYRKELVRLSRDILRALPEKAEPAEKLAALNRYLFAEQGFHGSRGEYYHRSNSYVNEVLDDREGLPLTLSIVYLELARRLELKVAGVGLPGHFVVRYEPAEGESQLIDVFERGAPLSRDDADRMIRAATGRAPREEDFAPSTKREMVVRMLHNLLGLAQRSQDADGMLRYLDTLAAISAASGPERWARAVLLSRTGRREEALQETQWLLQSHPEGVNPSQVEELRRILERAEKPN